MIIVLIQDISISSILDASLLLSRISSSSASITSQVQYSHATQLAQVASECSVSLIYDRLVSSCHLRFYVRRLAEIAASYGHHLSFISLWKIIYDTIERYASSVLSG